MDYEWPWEKRERERREQLRREQQEDRRLKHLEHEVEEIEQMEREELKLLHRAQSATLVIQTEGDVNMPATLIVGQSAEAVYQEFSLPGGQGVAVPNSGPIVFAVSDGTVVSVDAGTGHIVALAAGTATVTGSDAANGLNASDTVTVTGITAQSATLIITPNNDAPSGAPNPTPSPTPSTFDSDSNPTRTPARPSK